MRKFIRTWYVLVIVLALACLYGSTTNTVKMSLHRNVFLRDHDGSFRVPVAFVNGQKLTALVDTGADNLSLTPDVARKMGVHWGAATNDYFLADGSGHPCWESTALITVGTLKRQTAVSICPGNGEALLGMAFLKQTKMTMAAQTLRLDTLD